MRAGYIFKPAAARDNISLGVAAQFSQNFVVTEISSFSKYEQKQTQPEQVVGGRERPLVEETDKTGYQRIKRGYRQGGERVNRAGIFVEKQDFETTFAKNAPG